MVAPLRAASEPPLAKSGQRGAAPFPPKPFASVTCVWDWPGRVPGTLPPGDARLAPCPPGHPGAPGRGAEPGPGEIPGGSAETGPQGLLRPSPESHSFRFRAETVAEPERCTRRRGPVRSLSEASRGSGEGGRSSYPNPPRRAFHKEMRNKDAKQGRAARGGGAGRGRARLCHPGPVTRDPHAATRQDRATAERQANFILILSQ